MDSKEADPISQSETEPQPSEIQPETRTSPTRSRLFYFYLVGRIILCCVWTYFLLYLIFYGLLNFHQWTGFTTIQLTLECSVSYSDPMWNMISQSRTLLHILFAGLASIAGISCLFPGIALVEFRESNSRWGHLFVTTIEIGMTLLVIATGVCLHIETYRTIRVYRCHKYLGTLATYFMIAVIASGIFQWLAFPGNWTVLGLTIGGFVLMPVGVLHVAPSPNSMVLSP